MRKTLLRPIPTVALPSHQPWLDMANLAAVEVTSEEEAHPVEAALLPGDSRGWRANQPGSQLIRLIFDQPHSLRLIQLVCEEKESERTQEFVLRWSADRGGSFREIVRQQWNFSPPTTIRETEEYAVELSGVKILDLIITPDITGGDVNASLLSLRLA